VKFIVTDATGKVINEGDTITSFRGEEFIFLDVTRGGSRVYAQPKAASYKQEFFPSVFNLVVVAEAE
jgi:hypothetical protein